ncbi:MAG: phosphodiester glycosidase family protein [Acholeplasmataceae bacterium]|nr:MAG: phosphodiester glycosidase family protein [Acholeplasmataceae bacterium]
MHILKRIIVVILITISAMMVLAHPTWASVTIIETETTMIHGAAHTRTARQLQVGSTTVRQVYHVLEADFQSDDFAIITGDDYTSTGYRPATVVRHAQKSQADFGDEYLVIGGVNADFFEGWGVPQEAYIRNGHIVSQGIGYANRSVIGFRDDQSVAHGKPNFESLEVIVTDANGRERLRMPVKGVNVPYVSHPYELYVYTDQYSGDLPPMASKYVTEVIERKGGFPKLYVHGEVTIANALERRTVAAGQMVVVSNSIYLQNLVEPGDEIIVQARISGDFEDVRWAAGTYGLLVENGEKPAIIGGIDPTFRHPRTAIGVKADNSVFMVTVDGRQPGYSDGINLYDLADLMIAHGAVLAYNLDGGGSTTMVLRDDDDFTIANQPSGTPRQVTNSLLLAVRIHPVDRTPHPLPDYSQPLPMVEGLAVNNGLLTWQTVADRQDYEVQIGHEQRFTTSTLLNLASLISEPGVYPIQVRARGDGLYHGDGPWSETFDYVYEGPLKLPLPAGFALSAAGILTWDTDDPHDSYAFTVDGRTYTLSLNRFNLATLNLPPGQHVIAVRALGDGFNTAHSDTAIYHHRVYSAVEQEVRWTFDLFKELLYWRSR